MDLDKEMEEFASDIYSVSARKKLDLPEDRKSTLHTNLLESLTDKKFDGIFDSKGYTKEQDINNILQLDAEKKRNNHESILLSNDNPRDNSILDIGNLDYRKYNNIKVSLASTAKAKLDSIYSFVKKEDLSREFKLDVIGYSESNLNLEQSTLELLDYPVFDYEDDIKYRYSRNKINNRIAPPSNVMQDLKELMSFDDTINQLFIELDKSNSLMTVLNSRVNTLNKRYLVEPLSRYFLLTTDLYNEKPLKIAMFFSCIICSVNPSVFMRKTKLDYSEWNYINRCKIKDINKYIAFEIDRLLDTYLISLD